MAEIKLSETDLVLVSLALEEREQFLQRIGLWQAANHMSDLRQRWDGFCTDIDVPIDADVPRGARLTTEAA